MADREIEIRATPDGLPYSEVGDWAQTKYRLLMLYDQLFAAGMKHKWQKRVYIDLYAGSGMCRVRDTDTYYHGSPLLATKANPPFDKYILCEDNREYCQALSQRMAKALPHASVDVINGNCDARVNDILAAIPPYSPTCKVLCLCVVDPFDFGLKFETLKRLSDRFVDFLVLLAVGMDAMRNYDHYVDGNHTKLDEAFGNQAWRERWKQYHSKSAFRQFLAEEFSHSMEGLGYLPQTPANMKLVRIPGNNSPLYYLALFSRSQTAYDFWGQVLKYSTDQTAFW